MTKLEIRSVKRKMDKEKFAQRLNHLMKEQNLTVGEVAERIGASRASINAWQSGRKTPKWDKAFAMADLFQVSLSYLTGIEEEGTPVSLADLKESRP